MRGSNPLYGNSDRKGVSAKTKLTGDHYFKHAFDCIRIYKAKNPDAQHDLEGVKEVAHSFLSEFSGLDSQMIDQTCQRLAQELNQTAIELIGTRYQMIYLSERRQALDEYEKKLAAKLETQDTVKPRQA